MLRNDQYFFLNISFCIIHVISCSKMLKVMSLLDFSLKYYYKNYCHPELQTKT